MSASIERKAAELSSKVTAPRRKELEALVRALGEAKGEARGRAEEALLDLFLEIEGEDDETPGRGTRADR